MTDGYDDTGMDFPEDEDGNQIRGNGVKRSIWDPDQPENPAEGYRYRKPQPVPYNTGTWGNNGNPAWGAPTPGARWGDPIDGIDPTTGLPNGDQSTGLAEGVQEGTRGSVRYGGPQYELNKRILAANQKYQNARNMMSPRYHVDQAKARTKRRFSDWLFGTNRKLF